VRSHYVIFQQAVSIVSSPLVAKDYVMCVAHIMNRDIGKTDQLYFLVKARVLSLE